MLRTYAISPEKLRQMLRQLLLRFQGIITISFLLFGLYLALYGPVRIVTEFFREHDQAPPFGGPLTWTQWIALLLTVLGVWLVARSRKPAES